MHGERNVLHTSRGAEIQKKRTIPHTGGSKPNFRRKVEMVEVVNYFIFTLIIKLTHYVTLSCNLIILFMSHSFHV